ncbi:MAG: hypothetical protein IPM88_20725 [Nitrospira sp.]|nr:hypothetical protein [Nitrospira sp.]
MMVLPWKWVGTPLVAKVAEQSNSRFSSNPGHLGHFFPFSVSPAVDMIVIFLPNLDLRVPATGRLVTLGSFERELIEMIRVDPDFVTEAGSDDRQLRFLWMTARWRSFSMTQT